MTIKVGDKLPEAKFRVATAEGQPAKTTEDFFGGKKVALFALPGAYTGTCHKMHLPGIFISAGAIKGKGVDAIACTSVNDAFVMRAWKRDTGGGRRRDLACRRRGRLHRRGGPGLRRLALRHGQAFAQRYSMIVDDGVVKELNIEPAPGKVEVSGGDTLLGQL